VPGRITLWGAGEILNVFFSQTADPPPVIYLALIKDVAPTPYVSGAELDEPTAAEYARVGITSNHLNWTNEGAIQIMVCEADLSFATAQEDWGTIRYWALCNAEVDGFVYFVGNFDDPEIVNDGDTVIVSGGDLTVSLGPFFSEEG